MSKQLLRRGFTTKSALRPAYFQGILPLSACGALILQLALGAFVPNPVTGFNLQISFLMAAMIAMLAYELLRVGHPLTPAGISALAGLFLFVLRPWAVYRNGVTSPGAMLDSRGFADETVVAGNVALIQVGLFYLVAWLVFFSLVRRFRVETENKGAIPFSVARVRVLVVLVAVAAIGVTFLLLISSGGLAAHLEGVAYRSSFLAGRYFLTLGYVPFVVALALYVAVRRGHGLRTLTPLTFALATILCGVAFITGGRGPLLLGAVLPILLLIQTSSRPLRRRELGLLGVLLLVGAMIMSLTLRENRYDQGASLEALREDPVGTLADRLMSGAESRPFDSLILINEVEAQDDLPILWGATYARVPTWFVPGSVLPGKDSGANTWFTREYLPRFYYPEKIETSVSAIGEAYINFRYPGIILSAFFLGYVLAALGVTGPRWNPTRLTRIAVLTPVVFSFVRGDSYQTLSLAILVLVFSFLFSALIRSPRRSLSAWRHHRRVPARPSH